MNRFLGRKNYNMQIDELPNRRRSKKNENELALDSYLELISSQTGPSSL